MLLKHSPVDSTDQNQSEQVVKTFHENFTKEEPDLPRAFETLGEVLNRGEMVLLQF